MRDEEIMNVIAAPSRSWRGQRAGSLGVSLALHSALAFLLLTFSGATQAVVEPSLYEQVIQPHEDRIIWYPLKEIPRISPTEPGEARAETRSEDTIIHQAPDAAHDNRLVWRTPDRAEPERKTPAPDMVAVERGAEAQTTPVTPPDPPPASRPIPKTFVAPAAAPAAQAARVRLAEAPPPEVAKLNVPDGALAALEGSKLKVSRSFVPPPPSKKPAQGDGGTGVSLPDAPTLPGSAGASDINALVVNSLHVGGIDAAPPRQSAISTGPETGPASGNGGKGGIQIPDVTLAPGGARPQTVESTLRLPNDPLKGPPGGPAGSPPIFVTPRIAPLEHTLSAPLPPSSRMIPKAVEARFNGRVVYNMLLPMKGLPGYAGDWTIWFAERPRADGTTGSTAPMRAPLPVRKPAQADPALAVPPGEVQVAGRVTIAGKLDSLTVIGGAAPAVEAALKDLDSWQFLPALRSHEAVEVDLIITIPFGISGKLASQSSVPVLPDVDRTRGAQHN